MPIDINWILPVLIIGGLIIIVYCKATGQTLGEMLHELRDFFAERKEEIAESRLGNYGR